jgi:hypothetical protein
MALRPRGMVHREPVHRGERQQIGLLRSPGTDGLGFCHNPLSRPEALVSLGCGQICGRLWRTLAAVYAQKAISPSYKIDAIALSD